MPHEETAHSNIVGNGIYLNEGADYAGPFHGFEDAERFLLLMTFFGEDCSAVKIVEIKIKEDSNSDDPRTESVFSAGRGALNKQY